MQLEAKENRSRFFDIQESSFPLVVKCPAKKYYIESWGDLNEMLLSPVGGLSLIEHARTLSVADGKKWKHISLESLAYIPEIAMFLVDYSRATAEYARGYLFPGDFSEQPHIYYGIGQAFDIISLAKSECELENIRIARQKAKRDGGN